MLEEKFIKLQRKALDYTAYLNCIVQSNRFPDLVRAVQTKDVKLLWELFDLCKVPLEFRCYMQKNLFDCPQQFW